MIRLVKIFICCLIFFVVKAENKIENINIQNTEYLQITLYLSSLNDYTTKFENGILKIGFNQFEISDNFPGSQISVKSKLASKVFLSKGDQNCIIVNIVTGENVRYILQGFKNSSSLVIYFYDYDQLSESNKLFFKGLEFEVKDENEKALIEYRKLLATYPNHAQGLFHAGIIRKKMGFNYQAKANLTTSKKMGNSYPEVYYQLSNTYESLKDNDQATQEKKLFEEILSKEKNKRIDSSIAIVENDNKNITNIDSSFIAINNKNIDTSKNIISKSKPLERRVIRTLPVDNSSYYYSLAATIGLIILVISGFVSIIIHIKKRKLKKNTKRKRIDIKENVPSIQNNEFLQMVNSYKSQYEMLDEKINQEKKQVAKKSIAIKNESPKIQVEKNNENDIDRLARKYQVERGKIELALKLLAKNDTETTKDKYMLLMKMLKENMSLEEMASNLRVPKGELELVMNLKNS